MVPEPDEGRASELIQRASELNDLAEYAEAAELSARAIELEPDNALAHANRAWALENLGERHIEEARSIYETAIALDATAPWPRTALADLLHRTGSREGAERLYRDVAGDPAEPLADRPRCLEFRGWSLYRLGRFDEAIQTFHASIQGAPGRISVLFDLALSLLANGQPDEASETYAEAIETVHTEESRRRRAPLTVAVEDLEEAIQAHREIAELPSTPAIRELLRHELRALGPPGSPPSDGPGGTI
jgi:tetratricopeptide (TPR) repeat protein